MEIGRDGEEGEVVEGWRDGEGVVGSAWGGRIAFSRGRILSLRQCGFDLGWRG
jgi:hypothetical protein